ncbi:unnamed protein product [Moneuplotes crassus]|uniref:Uncharacterized protein n=1 Tax=Euplotes crassus TaxID=5936 RepID=A0AAD1UK88_EUPCR|nr:unnamed protein product [Moneuplotes crassus]
MLQLEKALDYWIFYYFQFRTSNLSNGFTEPHCIFIRNRSICERIPKDFCINVSEYYTTKRNNYPHPTNPALVFDNVTAFNQRAIVKFLETCRPTIIESILFTAKQGFNLLNPKLLMPCLMRFAPSLTGTLSFENYIFSNKQMSLLLNSVGRIFMIKFKKCMLHTDKLRHFSHSKSQPSVLWIHECCDKYLSNWKEHPERLEGIFKFISQHSSFDRISSVDFISKYEECKFNALAK